MLMRDNASYAASGLFKGTMRTLPVLLVFSFFSFACAAKAQMPEGMSSTVSLPEQWQLTLDVIKQKAQDLVVANNGLQNEYQQLMSQEEKLQESIYFQRRKNEKTSLFLKERHGRTDQQLRIEKLINMVKVKKLKARFYQDKLAVLKRKKAAFELKLRALRGTVASLQDRRQAADGPVPVADNASELAAEDQLTGLRQKASDESAQEALLEDQLTALKAGGNSQYLNPVQVESQNRQLETQLEMLQLQKLRHEKESANLNLAQANQRMYDHLKKDKEELEVKIYSFESRMDDLRHSSLMAMSWPARKKQLVHEMVMIDGRNNRIRDKIKDLQEDIGVLRDQVAKLESREDFIKGKALIY